MEIINFASSSAGNAYLVKSGTKSLLIESGLRLPQLRARFAASGNSITNLSAVVLSHMHGDHACGAAALSPFVPCVVASYATLKGAGVKDNGYVLHAFQAAEIDGFTVFAFPVEHDCEGAYGYVIEERQAPYEKLFFAIDTQVVRWNFSTHRFHHIMIEANHDDEVVVDKNIRRIVNSHMNISTTLETLRKFDLSQTVGIYLTHLSDGNANEARMLEQVAEATGKAVYACQKEGGMKRYGRTKMDQNCYRYF